MIPARYSDTISEGVASGLMGEIHGVVSVSFRHGLAFVRGNLHRPCGFGRNGTVSGVAPPHDVEALVRRRSPKSGNVALRNLVPLYLAGTTGDDRIRRSRVNRGEVKFQSGFREGHGS